MLELLSVLAVEILALEFPCRLSTISSIVIVAVSGENSDYTLSSDYLMKAQLFLVQPEF